MAHILQLFILIPLFAFLVSMVIPRNKEKVMSWLAVATTGIHLAGCVAFIIYWIIHGHAVLNIKHITLYKSSEFEFFINLYFDKTTAVFALVGSLIILLVSIFSRYFYTVMRVSNGFSIRCFCFI